MKYQAAALLLCLIHASVTGLSPPPGPPRIQGVQGNDDQVMSLHLLQNGQMADLKLRYDTIQKKLVPGNRRYNLFWSEFESTEPASAPFLCPAGTVLVPSNEVVRVLFFLAGLFCFFFFFTFVLQDGPLCQGLQSVSLL
jgi:hypothetical protein